VLIRAKYHWLLLSMALLDFVTAAIVGTIDPDHFMVTFYLGSAGVLFLVWSGTFTTLSHGVLKRRLIFFARRTIPVADIESVRPPAQKERKMELRHGCRHLSSNRKKAHPSTQRSPAIPRITSRAIAAS
jgi:hypothetical protein